MDNVSHLSTDMYLSIIYSEERTTSSYRAVQPVKQPTPSLNAGLTHPGRTPSQKQEAFNTSKSQTCDTKIPFPAGKALFDDLTHS